MQLPYKVGLPGFLINISYNFVPLLSKKMKHLVSSNCLFLFEAFSVHYYDLSFAAGNNMHACNLPASLTTNFMVTMDYASLIPRSCSVKFIIAVV